MELEFIQSVQCQTKYIHNCVCIFQLQMLTSYLWDNNIIYFHNRTNMNALVEIMFMELNLSSNISCRVINSYHNHDYVFWNFNRTQWKYIRTILAASRSRLLETRYIDRYYNVRSWDLAEAVIDFLTIVFVYCVLDVDCNMTKKVILWCWIFS